MTELPQLSGRWDHMARSESGFGPRLAGNVSSPLLRGGSFGLVLSLFLFYLFLPLLEYPTHRRSDQMEQFLRSHGLGRFAESFQAFGIESIHDLLDSIIVSDGSFKLIQKMH